MAGALWRHVSFPPRHDRYGQRSADLTWKQTRGLLCCYRLHAGSCTLPETQGSRATTTLQKYQPYAPTHLFIYVLLWPIWYVVAVLLFATITARAANTALLTAYFPVCPQIPSRK